MNTIRSPQAGNSSSGGDKRDGAAGGYALFHPLIRGKGMTDSTTTEPVLAAGREIIQKTLNIIARKIGAKYGLTEHDYQVLYVPLAKPAKAYWLIGGSTPKILFPMVPVRDAECGEYLERALARVASVKKSKALVRTDAEWKHEMYGDITRLRQIWANVEKERIPQHELHVEIIRKVVVTHKPTGLTAIMEAPEGVESWQKLSHEGRVELSKMVRVAQALKPKQEEPDAPQTKV